MKPFSTNETIKAYLYLHNELRTADEARDVINTLEGFRQDWQNLRNPYFERVFPQVFIAYAQACIMLGDIDKAIDILNEAKTELSHSDFRYFFSEKSDVHEMLTRCYVIKGDKTKAYEEAMESVFYKLYPFNNKHFGNYEFYSFRGVSEYSLDDLRNDTLSLCSPDLFNDPVDTALFPWLHYQREHLQNSMRGKELEIESGVLDVLEQAYSNLRARCLVRNIRVPYKEGTDIAVPIDSDREYANTLMWAHYADFHKGFCVKYVIPSSLTRSEPEDDDLLVLRPIEYVDSFPLMNDYGMFRNDITYLDALLTKHRKWEYEHEHRLLFFSRKGSPAFPVCRLPEGCIKAVYIGVKTSEDDRRKIINALCDRPEVEVYQMQISSEDIYKLSARKITDRAYRKAES